MRRCRRLFGGFTVALVALVAWDQGGMLSVGAVADERPVEVAGRSYSRPADHEALAARLRLPLPVISDAAAGELAAPAVAEDVTTAAPVPAAAGDIAIAPPPRAFARTGPTAPPPAPPPQLRSNQFEGVTPAGGTWAVVVGVNDYPGDGHDLRSAVNDANDLDEALGKLGVTGDRRLVLRDGQATAPMIRSSLEWLVAHAGPDATAVFFFAGHIQKVDKDSESLLGSDGAMVADVEMASILQRLQAKRTWIVLAACYAGGFTEVVQPGRILTAAASADALAYENARFNRSYLVEYMVRRAMLQQGVTTVEGAFSSAVAGLRRDHPNRLPVQQDHLSGDLDLRTGARTPSSAPAPAPAGNPPPSGQRPPDSTPEDPDDDDCADLTIGKVCGG